MSESPISNDINFQTPRAKARTEMKQERLKQKLARSRVDLTKARKIKRKLLFLSDEEVESTPTNI